MPIDGTDTRGVFSPRWYALRVRANQERRVSDKLKERGIVEFSPVYKTVSKWSDREKQVERPLFPGYTFARLERGQFVEVVRINGVVQILGNCSEPEAISDAEIESVRRIVESPIMANAVKPAPFEVGQQVTIKAGPLTGVTGIVSYLKSGARLIVSVEMLKRSVSVELPSQFVSV